MVVWLIGLAGAGKTTVAREVFAKLRKRKPNVVLLDGDDVRAIMGEDLGHGLEDRRRNAWRICRLCQYLDRQGIDVVCAILSIFGETQDWNRANLSAYFEVYLEVSIEVLKQRDKKGLYSRASSGAIRNVVGIDLPFTPPHHPNLIINNGQPDLTPAMVADQIIGSLEKSGA